MGYDLVLSSGFLAFARHTGFLRAVEELSLPVDALCGTSSGALVGALWLAGMDARSILVRLAQRRPISWARPHLAPWRGAFSLDGVVAELGTLLPADFAGLPRPFGAGVVTSDGGHRLLTAGPLPPAVAASCAVPWLFAPVDVGGEALSDGGAADRTGLAAWRAHRPDARAVLHWIERTAGAPGEPADVFRVVRSPRSGASMFSLGDVDRAFAESRALALAALGDLQQDVRG